MNFMLQRGPRAARAPGFIKSAGYTLTISVFLVRPGLAQEAEAHHPGPVTPLAVLLKEAEQNNPQIQAARDGWQSAKQVPAQVSALPDPQVQVQQLDVGSPRPFAGYSNSNFAYIGLGALQDIPYPGKLKLRGVAGGLGKMLIVDVPAGGTAKRRQSATRILPTIARTRCPAPCWLR